MDKSTDIQISTKLLDNLNNIRQLAIDSMD